MPDRWRHDVHRATRDRYRLAVTATTATVAAGAVVATGWLRGPPLRTMPGPPPQQARKDAVARQKYDAWVARYGDPASTRGPRPSSASGPRRPG